jgi:hypothetical protein
VTPITPALIDWKNPLESRPSLAGRLQGNQKMSLEKETSEASFEASEVNFRTLWQYGEPTPEGQ